MTTNRETTVTDTPCPYCDVTAEQPCVTRTGNTAARSHAARIREIERAQNAQAQADATYAATFEAKATWPDGAETTAMFTGEFSIAHAARQVFDGKRRIMPRGDVVTDWSTGEELCTLSITVADMGERADQLRADVAALLPDRWGVLALDTVGEEHVAVLVCRDGRDAATIIRDNAGYAVEGVMAENYTLADHWRTETVDEAVAHVLFSMRENITPIHDNRMYSRYMSHIDAAWRELGDDIANGRVSRDVESWENLHDYVDANQYGRRVEARDFEFAELHGLPYLGQVIDARIKLGLLRKKDV